MRVQSVRVITIFLLIFYIDALINLIRVYSVLQFIHFVLQLAVCHVMTQYKQTLVNKEKTNSNSESVEYSCSRNGEAMTQVGS